MSTNREVEQTIPGKEEYVTWEAGGQTEGKERGRGEEDRGRRGRRSGSDLIHRFDFIIGDEAERK